MQILNFRVALVKKSVIFMFGIIYKITNLLDGKIYVGQTKQSIEKRFQDHFYTKYHIGRAIREYGAENFKIELLEECETLEELNEKEKFWIKTLNCKSPNGYNLTDGGDGHYTLNEEARKKIAKANKKRVFTPEMRKKLSDSQKGKKLSAEHRAKISAANKGKKRSAETKAKMSEASKKRKMTEETREKISQSKKGKKLSPETCKKMSESKIGHTITEDTRAKMSASRKAYWERKHSQK